MPINFKQPFWWWGVNTYVFFKLLNYYKKTNNYFNCLFIIYCINLGKKFDCYVSISYLQPTNYKTDFLAPSFCMNC